MSRAAVVVVALFALFALPALADSIGTDRPGNGNAPGTVPDGRAQVETSFLFALEDLDGRHGFSFPTLARAGIGNAELRLGHGVVAVAHNDDELSASLPDLSLGAKVQLLEAGPLRPDLGISLDLTLPTGSELGGAIVPDLRVLGILPLPATFSILFNAGFDAPVDDEGRFVRGVFLLSIGAPLPVWDERIFLFAETFARFPLDFERPASVLLDAGVAVLLNDDLQIDLFTQHAILPGDPPLQVSLGLSARL